MLEEAVCGLLLSFNEDNDCFFFSSFLYVFPTVTLSVLFSSHLPAERPYLT